MRQSNSQSREAQEGHWIYKRNPNIREENKKKPLQVTARGKLFGNDQYLIMYDGCVCCYHGCDCYFQSCVEVLDDHHPF